MQKEKLLKLLEILDVVDEGNQNTPEKVYGGGSIKIVILQRGHVAIGRFYRNSSNCEMRDTSFIRKWGTTEGLGQLALSGKQSETLLDRAGIINFDYLTVIATIDCKEELWENEL